MNDTSINTIDLDQTEEETLTCEFSDEALEAAAGPVFDPAGTAWMGTRYRCCP